MKHFDLQVNGYAGTDFCSMDLTAEQLNSACLALEADGGDCILATVITDSLEKLRVKLANLVHLREQDPLAKKIIAGIHIEGPFLNPAPGFIGAHPAEAVKLANVDDTKRLLEAAGGLTRIVTLAPEMDPYHQTTRFLAEQNIVVSAGHTNASLDQLHGSIDSGLTMATHLGNGCPTVLPRHDNIIQRILSLREHLWVGFIPDGFHIDFFALRNYLDFVGINRAFMVTDAITAARLGPGVYDLSGAIVEVDEMGIARRPGSPNLSGSTLTMSRLRLNLKDHLDLSDSEIEKLVDLNPRKALGMAD